MLQACDLDLATCLAWTWAYLFLSTLPTIVILFVFVQLVAIFVLAVVSIIFKLTRAISIVASPVIKLEIAVLVQLLQRAGAIGYVGQSACGDSCTVVDAGNR